MGKASSSLLLGLVLGALMGGATVYVFVPRGAAEEHDSDDDDHPPKPPPKGEEKDEVVRLDEPARAVARIRSAPVEKRRMGTVLTALGTVRPNAYRVAHVAPRAGGKVTDVSGVLGARVKAGDALAVLDSTDVGTAAADFLKAKSALEVARANNEREEELLKKNATRGVDVYEARGSFLKAQADYQAARGKLLLLGWAAEKVDALKWDDPAALSRLTVTAPIEGEITERHAVLGELVGTETRLFTISDPSTVWVVLDLPQQDARQAHAGQAVEIVCDAHPGKLFKGRIATVAYALTEATRTLEVRVEVDNREGLLRPGMSATAMILDDDEAHARDVVTVPGSAIQKMGAVPVVFVERAPGEYLQRPVTLAGRFGDLHEILVGLSPGEKVVVEGAFILKSELLRSEMVEDH